MPAIFERPIVVRNLVISTLGLTVVLFVLLILSMRTTSELSVAVNDTTNELVETRNALASVEERLAEATEKIVELSAGFTSLNLAVDKLHDDRPEADFSGTVEDAQAILRAEIEVWDLVKEQSQSSRLAYTVVKSALDSVSLIDCPRDYCNAVNELRDAAGKCTIIRPLALSSYDLTKRTYIRVGGTEQEKPDLKNAERAYNEAITQLRTAEGKQREIRDRYYSLLPDEQREKIPTGRVLDGH
jgi:Na+-transporting methylmalonyl-CoA/oxaloacetate decarboxylase gamma subunit